jgi:hypothetical protein
MVGTLLPFPIFFSNYDFRRNICAKNYKKCIKLTNVLLIP